MVREDLVNGAVSFLQDPSVASAPIDQRIAFLRSKNLTQEEIDLSLARTGAESPSNASSSPPAPQQYAYQQSPPPYQQGPPPGFGGYQNGYWQQPPPPEVPRRDWRDWFIMATVMGGVGYGVYFVAKRYIYPLVAPPTPPQLEQDKASIDTSFEKAFALLDQLATDTEELKSSEKSRTERLDVALSEVEAVMGSMKEAGRRRDDESRRLNDEIRALRDLIPKALEAQKESSDQKLKDLGGEMKSLKTLMTTRVSAPQPASSPAPSRSFQPSSTKDTGASEAQPTTSTVEGSHALESANGVNDGNRKVFPPDRAGSSSPYGRVMNGRAAIPAWQMAASKKNDEAQKDTAESGTAVDGATA